MPKNTNKLQADDSMEKKIVAQLTSIAHRILQMKNKEDVLQLKSEARELYEKLSVLAFVQENLDAGSLSGNDSSEKIKAASPTDSVTTDEETVNLSSNSENIVEENTAAVINDQDSTSNLQNEVEDDTVIDNYADENEDHVFASNDLSDLFVPVDEDTREEMDLPGIKTIHKMVEEMPDEVPEVEIELPDTQKYMKNDFEEITADFKEMPVFERKVNDTNEDKPKSLNERLNAGMKIGMNDRLGFVKHLFGGSDQDFNRVVSQLNTIPSYDQALQFINTMVKPDYNNWSGKEPYEQRFLEIVERSF